MRKMNLEERPSRTTLTWEGLAEGFNISVEQLHDFLENWELYLDPTESGHAQWIIDSLKCGSVAEAARSMGCEYSYFSYRYRMALTELRREIEQLARLMRTTGYHGKSKQVVCKKVFGVTPEMLLEFITPGTKCPIPTLVGCKSIYLREWLSDKALTDIARALGMSITNFLSEIIIIFEEESMRQAAT